MHAKRWFLASLVLAGAALPCFADGGTVRVIVGFKGSADADAVKGGGGDVIKTVGGDAVVAEIPAGKVNALRANANVAYVEEDGYAEAFRGPPGGGGGGGSTSPSPEIVPWGVDKVLSLGGGTRTVGLHTGAGVKVAVIDTGIDLDHPDLVDRIPPGSGKTFVARTTSPNDDNGHGSHCAGTIGATDNSEGVIGVAPGVQLYPVKVLDKRGSGYWSDVADGILWAMDAKMDIASMSLGGGANTTVEGACATAYDSGKGVLLIAAAGNSGDGSIGTTERSWPAYYSTVVSVGATDSNDALTSFSNTNDDVEVSAPGYKVPSTYKDGGYATLSGTSMACPHAAGIAAILKAENSTKSAGEIDTLLRSKVVKPSNGLSYPNNGYGAGRVDIDPSSSN